MLLHIGTNDMFGSDADFNNVGTRLDQLITDITTQSPQTHLIVAKIINSLDATTEAQDSDVQRPRAGHCGRPRK